MLPFSIAAQIDLRRNLGQMRREISELQEILELRNHERACLDLKYQLAALRFEIALIKHDYVCRKAGFREDQPRWPKGSGEDSGRWSGGAGNEPPSNEPSANPRSTRGHHFVPGELYRNEPLKPETRQVFERATTGPIRFENHGYSEAHKIYNEAVIERFNRFKAENGNVRSEDVTPEQAKKFVEEIKRSSDPRIRNYNMRIFKGQMRYIMRYFRIPRGTE